MPNHDGTGPNGGCCKQGEQGEKHNCCDKEQHQHRHGQEGGCCGKGKGNKEQATHNEGCCGNGKGNGHGEHKDGCCQKQQD